MRSIDVDTDVFAAIWALRHPPEVSENDILRRVLLGKKELNNSKILHNEPRDSAHGNEAREVTMTGSYKVRWIDDVLTAFHRLGGEVDLAQVYRLVDKLRVERGERQIKTLEATVRRVIEEHSSDSDNFGRNVSAPDHFAKVGRGRWRLR